MDNTQQKNHEGQGPQAVLKTSRIGSGKGLGRCGGPGGRARGNIQIPPLDSFSQNIWSACRAIKFFPIPRCFCNSKSQQPLWPHSSAGLLVYAWAHLASLRQGSLFSHLSLLSCNFFTKLISLPQSTFQRSPPSNHIKV